MASPKTLTAFQIVQPHLPGKQKSLWLSEPAGTVSIVDVEGYTDFHGQFRHRGQGMAELKWSGIGVVPQLQTTHLFKTGYNWWHGVDAEGKHFTLKQIRKWQWDENWKYWFDSCA